MGKKWLSHSTMKSLGEYISYFLKSEYLSLVLRYFMGIMFLYAGLAKISYPAEFAESIASYQLVPYWTRSINLMAVLMPWLELICGLFLVLGIATRAASCILGLLLGVFTIAIAVNVIKGTPISCGCFDSVGSQISWRKVLEDVFLALLTVQIFLFDRVLLLHRGRILFKRHPLR